MHCRILKENDSLIIKEIFNYQQKLNIENRDSVLSIGAGSGYREFVYAFYVDSVTFLLEDIDTTCVSTNKIRNVYLPHYSTLKGSPFTCSFWPVYGTDTTINLGNSLVGKVLIYNVYHHFTNDMDMMLECLRVLKSGGSLIIGEHVLKRNRKSYKFCDFGGYYKTEENFVSDIEILGFVCDTVISNGKYWRDFFFRKQ
jgi:SAM-dependent methyltransferase